MARITRTAPAVITAILAAALLLTGCTPDKPAVSDPEKLVEFQATELESRGYTDVTFVGVMGDSATTKYDGYNKFWVGVGENCRFKLYASQMSEFYLVIGEVDFGDWTLTAMKDESTFDGCFE